ncbi:uncharacterized protein LOC142322340 [Lycorma delicatula]|uniref:uncharacterized protein LOC142322340 n=1 Tax=Lycorma delicatula TaxID=130591 RepID=UPI003F511DFA
MCRKNKITVETPTWLTKDYIKTALQHDEKTKDIISIETMKIDNPIAPGNNGSCLIHRVQAEYKLKDEEDLLKFSLILKVPMKTELHAFVAEKGVYKKEMQIYNEI